MTISDEPPQTGEKDIGDVPVTNPVSDDLPHDDNFDNNVQIKFTNTQVDPSSLLPSRTKF